VNAHHKNGIAEQGIHSVSEIARSLLLHAGAHWPEGVDGSLWPSMAVDYACHLHNSLPNSSGTCPADLFTGAVMPRHKLRDLHVWGCPIYVLDPTLQQGKKLPRWQSCSRCGVFLGYSPHHSSDVPLILNLQTGSISPQYHVVFDDSFSTVHSIREDDAPPDFWNTIDLDSFTMSIPFDPSDPDTTLLPNDWLTPHELEKRRRLTRQDKIRDSYVPPLVAGALSPGGASFPRSATGGAPPPGSPSSRNNISSRDDRLPLAGGAPTSGGAPIAGGGVSEEMPVVPPDTTPALPASPPPPLPPVVPVEPSSTNVPQATVSPPPLRCTSRTTKGTYNSTKYIDEVYLTSLLDTPRSHQETELTYQAE
jgi:hypothetical protein